MPKKEIWIIKDRWQVIQRLRVLQEVKPRHYVIDALIHELEWVLDIENLSRREKEEWLKQFYLSSSLSC